jgi:uncharacterized protein YkwD
MNTILIRSAFCLTILLALLGISASCSVSQPNDKTSSLEQRNRPRVGSAQLEKRIHNLVNKERQRQGLSILKYDEALVRIARKHSQDMANRSYFDHYTPEGKDHLFRYKRDGYQCSVQEGRVIHMGAENIALNHLYDSVTTINGVARYDWNSEDKIAVSTVEGWMKSPGHRHNILTPYFLKQGIGIFISPDDKVYITQNFC